MAPINATPEQLRECLVEAYEVAKRLGCFGNVYRNSDGELVAGPIVPTGPARREWLIVRPDGVILKAEPRVELGTMEELGS